MNIEESRDMEAFEITEIESIETPSTLGDIVLVGGIYIGVVYGIAAC